MDIVLALAGGFVTLLVVVAMVLIVPRGVVAVDESVSELSAAPKDEEAPVPAAAA